MKITSWRRMLPNLLLILILSAAVSVSAAKPKPPKPTPASASAKVEADLTQAIDQSNHASYMIYFRDKPDLSAAYDLPWEERGWYVMNALQESAELSQKSVRAYLDSQGIQYQSFWIDNIIIVEDSDGDSVNSLMSFPEIEALRARRNPVLFTPDERSPALEPTSIESNITHVNADDVWSLGYTGEGIVVANIDTGVRYTHQALVNQYRGNLGGGSFNHNYHWWDPYLNSTTPSDSDSHGSHTMGTMLGDDGGSNQIGMAPNAEWIACKSFSGGDVDTQLLECAQFMLSPWDLTGSNANPSKRPHVINNSWGDCGRSYDDWYEDTINAWLAAGIYPVFSNGNASNCDYATPPGLDTVGNPARYGNVTGVGASGRNNGEYAAYSNWGPTDNADTINPRGYPTLKPQVVAPGTNRSAYKTSDTSYGNMSGTSMAAPHVAGLIALMWSAAPCLVGDYASTETIIEQTANSIDYDDGTGGGAHTPNYATGWGEINALEAVQAAVNSCGPFYLQASPDNMDVCAPNDAVYEVDIIQNEPGLEDAVTLNSFGAPDGYTPSFSSNPVTPPSSSQLTLAGSDAATFGSYNISIAGESPTSTYTTTVGLNLYTAAPGSVTLTTPANGATNVALPPTFSWESATQAASYYLEIATDNAFSNIIYSATTQSATHQAMVVLDSLSAYYWRVTANNACDDGAASTIYNFRTLNSAPILLVDDDDNLPDVRSYYTIILDNLGLRYDIWDTGYSDNEPTSIDLTPYNMVVWFTGYSFGFIGPGAAGETALGDWLDNGNCLFLSSQDYYWDRGLTSFMTSYLGVASMTDDDGDYTSVTGQGDLFSGLGPYTLTYPFTNYSDIINPSSAAQVGLRGNNSNNAAINKDSGDYRTTFWAFPFEALSFAAREQTMQVVADWCNSMPISDNFYYLPLITKQYTKQQSLDNH